MFSLSSVVIPTGRVATADDASTPLHDLLVDGVSRGEKLVLVLTV